jgi:hypothetical protein
LLSVLGAGCGGDTPSTDENPVNSAGSGATPVLGNTVGGAPQSSAGTGTGTAPIAGKSGTGTSGSPAMHAAGGALAAGSGTAGAAAGIGAAGASGSTAGSGLAAGSGAAGMAGSAAGMSAAGGGATMGAGACCSSGDCLCHGDPPMAPTNSQGPYKTASYDIASAGCVYYPMDAEPPFAAVTISDGFGGAGGCGRTQTNEWGPLYASWGIVAMIIHTGSGDQPNVRGMKLSAGIEAFKMENTKSGSPLMGKLSGRYGTSGFSMGGGGTTFSAAKDPTLKTNVAIMAWGPTNDEIKIPSLFIFGSSDTVAGTMGMAPYTKIGGMVPKMSVTIQSSHAGQPSSGMGASGKAGLAFQKVFLEGDERWRPVLLMVKATDSANIQ